ncbi:MAG: site-specific integrase, partial [Deltaproteobacteria bacterium]
NLGTRPGPSELFSLKWKDVDWEKGQVWIYGRKTKQWRAVPIGDHFLVRLREMKDKAKTEFIIEYQGKPIKKLRRSLESACRRAGIPYRVRMYDVRHLFASVMLAGGADLAAVAAIMGHSIDTLQRNYYELLKGEKKRAIQLLPLLSGPQKGPQNAKRGQAI